MIRERKIPKRGKPQLTAPAKAPRITPHRDYVETIHNL
jgi:hypothetical protein